MPSACFVLHLTRLIRLKTFAQISLKTGLWGMLYLFVSFGIVSAEILNGRELYEGACQSCHGQDGRGAAEGTAIRVPLPDLTDCSFNSREPDSDWVYVIAHGGAYMGLSDQMPAFEDALTQEQMQTVLTHVRGFCQESGWPRGELNFRRLLSTTKAFPESEAVLTHGFTQGKHGVREWTTRFVFEQRIGARGQWELVLPYKVKETRKRTTQGPGDMAVAYKRVLSTHDAQQAITAAALQVVLPSGDRHRGLGDETVKFQPSLLSGIALKQFIFQNQVQAVLPVDEDRAQRQMRYRLAGSYVTSPFKRGLVPSLELEVRHNLQGESNAVFLLTPQLYTGIRFRGHVAFGLGAQIPIAGTDPFHYRIGAFLLWEYQDGGLWW